MKLTQPYTSGIIVADGVTLANTETRFDTLRGQPAKCRREHDDEAGRQRSSPSRLSQCNAIENHIAYLWASSNKPEPPSWYPPSAPPRLEQTTTKIRSLRDVPRQALPRETSPSGPQLLYRAQFRLYCFPLWAWRRIPASAQKSDLSPSPPPVDGNATSLSSQVTKWGCAEVIGCSNVASERALGDRSCLTACSVRWDGEDLQGFSPIPTP